MNNFFYTSGICAATCLFFYIIAVNLDYFLPYQVGKFKSHDIIKWTCNIPFWLAGIVGCISFALGCFFNMS
jgi:hypothetical protein